MIEARGLVKRYGSTVAVDDLSFSVRPGVVTGQGTSGRPEADRPGPMIGRWRRAGWGYQLAA
jgi:hypothetical protein